MMFRQLVRLELKKHRMLLISLLAISLLSFIVITIVSYRFASLNAGEALRIGYFSVLVLAGVFLPMIFGASFSISLRQETMKAVEDQLPAGPFRRSVAALCASFLCLLIAALIFAIPGVPLSGVSFFDGDLMQAGLVVLAGLVMIQPICFLFCYWTRLPILGNLLALLLVPVRWLLTASFGWYDSPLSLFGALAVAMACEVAALYFLTQWLDRTRTKAWKHVLLLIGLLLSFPLNAAIFGYLFWNRFPPPTPRPLLPS